MIILIIGVGIALLLIIACLLKKIDMKTAIILTTVAGASIIAPLGFPDDGMISGERYVFECDNPQTMINDTIVRYELQNITINKNVLVCEEERLRNGSQECGYERQDVTSEINVSVIDGGKYLYCPEAERKEVTIAKDHYRETTIDLEGKTSSVRGNTLTIKELRSATYADGRPDDCWHPNIPCEQINVRTNEKVRR